VLTETPGLARVPVNASASGDVVTFAAGVSIGPFAAPAGPFAAYGLFNAAEGGAMEYSATMTPLFVAPNGYLSFPGGAYTMTPAVAPGADVLTIGGVPLTVGGQPLRVA
jgi:hypothetical protein